LTKEKHRRICQQTVLTKSSNCSGCQMHGWIFFKKKTILLGFYIFVTD
jgi:hypothetical protein